MKDGRVTSLICLLPHSSAFCGFLVSHSVDIACLCVTQVFQLAALSGVISTGHVHLNAPLEAPRVMEADWNKCFTHSLFSAVSHQVLLQIPKVYILLPLY